MVSHIIKDMHNYIKKIDESVHSIDLNRYLLLNGIIISKDDKTYGEYVKINSDNIEYIHIPLDKYNGIIENNFLTYRLKDNDKLNVLKVEKYNEEEIENIKNRLLYRIAKYFTINEFAKIGFSPQFIDKNFKKLLDGHIFVIKDDMEIFNQNLPLFYIEAMKKCNDMDCIYKVYKRKFKDVKYIISKY